MKKLTKEQLLNAVYVILDNVNYSDVGKLNLLLDLENSDVFNKKFLKYLQSAKFSLMYTNVLLFRPILKTNIKNKKKGAI
jgi:hypothetical protein